MKENEKLFRLIEEGTSPIQVVQASAKQLKEAGFEELQFAEKWELKAGKGYFFVHHDTTLYAFTTPEADKFCHPVRIAAAHTDFPCLRIKYAPEVESAGYRQLNVEVYGGAILNTWLDRPLAVSGRVAVKSGEVFKPQIRYIDSKRPLLTIPNLAIHMNREVNKGVELNKQTEMLPILGMAEAEMPDKEFFITYLAEELDVDKNDILDFELCVYSAEKPEYVGLKEEFISAPRLDNLTSVQALLTGIIDGKRKDGINMIALFDHEEIGSRTKQGAGSMLLSHIIEKILSQKGYGLAEIRDCMYESMLLSVDVAHGLHPNYAGKMDITNKPVLNGGFCIKEASSQSYATDCEAIGMIEQVCGKMGADYQKFLNRSDMPGGGTLGSIASSLLPVRTVDIGVPLLAMHSAREMMGSRDMEQITLCVRGFFQL